MDNNNGLSDQSQDEQIDNDAAFSAIAEAMTAGNYGELDRLMAVEDPEKKEDKAADDQATDSVDEKDQSTKVDDVVDDATKKETAPAVSTGTPNSDALAAMQAELHRLRSEVGRVNHLQRTVHELQRQTQAPKTTEQIPASKTKELPEDLQKRITALKEVDPEMAETFEVFAKTLAQQTEQETSSVRQTFEERQREAEEAQFWQAQKQELYKLVPRCDDVFAMPEWTEWKESLTPGQRGMAESAYAPDVATAINAFAHHMVARQGGHQVSASATAGGGDPKQTQVDTHDDSNEAVNDARTRKVAAAAGVKSSAAKKESTLDEKAFFEEMYNKIGKENHILPR